MAHANRLDHPARTRPIAADRPRPTFRVGELVQTGPPKARGAELQAMIPSRHSCALRLEVGRPSLFPSPAMSGFLATQDFPRFGLQVPIPSPHGSPKTPLKTHANPHPMSAGFPTMHPRCMTHEPASAGENRGRAFGLRVGSQIPTQGRPSISPGCAMFLVPPHRKGNRLVLRFSAHFTPATKGLTGEKNRVPLRPSKGAGVVKLVDTPDLGSGASAWGFESLHPHTFKKP